MSNTLQNNPYIGTNDYLPDEFRKLQYIFSKWRNIAKKYGYQEYLTPVLEYAEIYEAKSGEDIKKELFTLTDAGGRRLALRPEMTPSVTRLVTKVYGAETKPLRYFSIANFFRGEKPQKGRDREFWQLNIDLFGSESIYSDLEILMSAIDLMRSFGAPTNSFILKLNHRKLIDFFLRNILNIESKELKSEVVRKLDKYKKLSKEDFTKTLEELGLNQTQIELTEKWMTSELNDLKKNFPNITNDQGYKDIIFLINTLEKLGYKENIEYSTELIRGFDYYDGSIFEVFDRNPAFSRSLFGGGRYNGLAELFGNQKIPAVGYAPGSPISIFLDNWNLWPNFDDNKQNYFLPILSDEYFIQTMELAQKLRQEGKILETGVTISDIPKSLSYANKRKIEFVVIYGENEIKNGEYIIKNMKTGEQNTYKL